MCSVANSSVLDLECLGTKVQMGDQFDFVFGCCTNDNIEIDNHYYI